MNWEKRLNATNSINSHTRHHTKQKLNSWSIGVNKYPHLSYPTLIWDQLLIDTQERHSQDRSPKKLKLM